VGVFIRHAELGHLRARKDVLRALYPADEVFGCIRRHASDVAAIGDAEEDLRLLPVCLRDAGDSMASTAAITCNCLPAELSVTPRDLTPRLLRAKKERKKERKKETNK